MPDVPPRKKASVVLASVLSAAVMVAGIIAAGIVLPDSPMVTPTSAAETQANATELGAPGVADGASTETDPAAVADVTGDLSQIRNVVLLLADDLDWPLFMEVPRLREFMDEGTTLSNFVVTESLCCPSRTSILRSQYVHNHDVISNIPQTGGGWQTFYDLGHQKDCLPIWLSRAGVQTSYVGKYLNGFPGKELKPTYTPPGWANFVSTGRGKVVYTGYDYVLNDNGTLRSYGKAPTDFLEDVLTAKTLQLIDSAADPFYLQFSSYLPHAPSPAAPRYRGSRAGSQAPRTPNFNAYGVNEPAWLRTHDAIGERRIANLDRQWTRRLESAESMADSFHAIMDRLEVTGHSEDTLVIITSDNGYHIGSHRIASGKHTPYREDSVVPAILIGPGIARGATIDKMTSTIDLAPTIAELQGASAPGWVDGRSLVPLLRDPQNAPWRTGVLTANVKPTTPDDPDYSGFEAPRYNAVRTQQWLYVDYGSTQGAALYNVVTDPYELNNVVASTDPAIVSALAAQTRALATCRAASCRTADSMPVPALPSTNPPPAPAPAEQTPTSGPTPDSAGNPTSSPYPSGS